MFFYARLKPYNPRLGYTLLRYHFQENLFVGGDRPTWYKVEPALAVVLKNDHQESGRESFDVVTIEEKQAIDKIEEERRLVAMGMMAATMVGPARTAAVDLAALTKPAVSARAAAIPDTKESTGGDLTSSDVKSPAAE